MRHAPLLLLLALGCSETPSVPAADAQVAADLCVCQDGTVPPDVALEDHPDVVDAGGPDVVDAPAPVDAPDVVLVDAPELADLVPADALDAAAPDVADAGLDAAVVDAPDVQLADVVEDRPDVVAVADVVDAARDAGPVVYDLNTVRTGLEIVVLHRRLSERDGAPTDCTAAPTAPSCSVVGDTLRFAFRQCSADFVGVFALTSDAGTRALSLSTSGAGNFAPRLRFTAGTPRPGSPSRQSFLVQFGRDAAGSEPGATGIPSRTVDPALGDIWLLGCSLN